jgi:ketosteroid isomerase-like protein
MSDEQANLDAVQRVFAAFARGDTDAALSMMRDDVDWQKLGPAELGYTAPYRGRDAVKLFFDQVDALFAHDQFQADRFVCQGDTVVVCGRERVTARRTNISFDNQWCMIFTFDTDGRIARWRCYEDTARVLAALRGERLS